MNLLFANNAASTLASGLGVGSTTIVLSTGTGSLFPNPGAGEAFYMTLQDASTQLTNEIVLCTNRAGDVLTVKRGQQGTAALVWSAGDFAQQLVTEGDLANMIQPDQLQAGLYSATGATGTNSITATLNSELSALPDLMSFTLRAAAANTGAVTLTLTLGATVLPAHNLVKYGGSALSANDIPAAGYPCLIVWSAVLGAYVLCNPGTSVAGGVAGGVANDLLIQTAPGTTGFVGAPTIAGQVLSFFGGVVQWAAAAVTTFNGRSGAVVPQAGDYNAAQVGAVPASSFQGANVQLAIPGFYVLPNGWIHNAGNRVISPNVRTVITYPKSYPNAAIATTASCNNAAAAINVEYIDRFSFAVTANATLVQWQSDGF